MERCAALAQAARVPARRRCTLRRALPTHTISSPTCPAGGLSTVGPALGIRQEVWCDSRRRHMRLKGVSLGTLWVQTLLRIALHRPRHRVLKRLCARGQLSQEVCIFVMRFPFLLHRRYDTNAGETGAQVSGGQKQRIAIARAILKVFRSVVLSMRLSLYPAANTERLMLPIH